MIVIAKTGHFGKALALSCAVAFVLTFWSDGDAFAGVTGKAKTEKYEPESLREVLRNGRPGNLFTLSENRSELCQGLLDTFNKPFPKREGDPSGYPPVLSDIVLKSPLSIEWTIVDNNGVSSLSIGHADIDNDGNVDWLSEYVTWTNIWPGYQERVYWFIPPPVLRRTVT